MSPFSHGAYRVFCISFTLQLLVQVNGDEINSLTDHPHIDASSQPRHSLGYDHLVVEKRVPARDHTVSSNSTRTSSADSVHRMHKDNWFPQDRSFLLGHLLQSLLQRRSQVDHEESVAPLAAQKQIIPQSQNNFLHKHSLFLDLLRQSVKKYGHGQLSRQVSRLSRDWIQSIRLGTGNHGQIYHYHSVPDHAHSRKKRSSGHRIVNNAGLDIFRTLHARPSADSSKQYITRVKRRTKAHRKWHAQNASSKKQHVLAELDKHADGSKPTSQDSSIDVLANLSSKYAGVPSLTGYLNHKSGDQDPSTGPSPDHQEKEVQHLPNEREALLSAQSPSVVTVPVVLRPSQYLGLDGKPINMTEFTNMLRENEMRRQLNREAQWAYMCLVVLICLMMLAMWCLGGLEKCRYRPSPTANFSDSQHLMSVRDVLEEKRQYLPMFNEPDWEEVLMCDRATDP